MEKDKIFKKLREADTAYYATGNTIMDDSVYDALKDEAFKKYPNDSYFSGVGFNLKTSKKIWVERKHWNEMGSQRKAADMDKLESNFGPFENELLVAQEKLDGFSLEVNYSKGKVVSAITRGDGITGEDVLKNIKNAKGFFNYLQYEGKSGKFSFNGSLYCEGIISRKDFETFKKEYVADGNSEPANPRNSASGIVHREDGKYSEFITLKYFGIKLKGYEFKTELEQLRYMAGLVESKNVVKNFKAKGLKQIGMIYETYIKYARKDCPHQIDGLVIKINDLLKQEKLGVKRGRPQGQIALKFPSPTSVTTLLGVSWSVSRNGRINPIADLKEVVIDGTKVARASLHNVKRINELELELGAKVILKKGGDIIPEIVEKIEDGTEEIEIPTVCPTCKEQVKEDDTFIWCVNDNCKSRMFARLLNYFKVIGIENVGKGLLTVLFDNNIVTYISDIYKVTRSDLVGLAGIGDSTIDTYFSEVERTKTMKPEIFLKSLGIQNLSESTSKALLKRFTTVDTILGLTAKQMSEVDGIAVKTATQFVEGLEDNKELIEELRKYVKIEVVQKSGPFVGKSFCITGSLEDGNKKHYAKIIEDLGGNYESSVKAGLTYLVANDKTSTSGKAQKAKKLGIEIIDEEELKELIKTDK